MSAARRKRKTAIAGHIAAGTHVRRHRSLFETAEIRDAVQAELTEQRKMIAALRKPNLDPSWHYDEATAKEHAGRV